MSGLFGFRDWLIFLDLWSDMENQWVKSKDRLRAKWWLLAMVLVVYEMLFDAFTALAQDGNAGITQATTMVKGYFDTGVTLMYAVGAVVGIVGAVKVFQKWTWQSGSCIASVTTWSS